MKFYIYLWNKCQKKSNQLITLLNEGKCFSYVIFLENYSNGISQNKMYETTMTKIIRIFTLWCNGSIQSDTYMCLKAHQWISKKLRTNNKYINK